jgi:tetratricopeptide (TPR) repeat protein
MSDDEIKELIEAATKESLRESFTEAGKKYLKAAETAVEKGDYQESENLYRKSAEAFLTAAERFRSSKSYKNAALNMCLAGDVYSDMAQAQQAVDAYSLAAEDLFNASGEYLMWGEDAEVRKGTALAMAACMMYIMIGKEADAFYKARTYAAENASKLKFPAVIRLSQIPQMIESAIQSVDIAAFAEAENATVTELKAALSSSGANEFIPYVDKGLNMVREILRGRLKMPKISAQLDLPVDVIFNEEFPLKVVVQNSGDGDASRLKAEWLLDPGLNIVSGDKTVTFPTLPPEQSVTMDIKVIASQEGEYSIMVRGSYSDKLQTDYSLQAGPGKLVVREYKESAKLSQAIDVTGGRIGILTASILDSEFESAPLEKFAEVLTVTLEAAKQAIEDSELEAAKAMVKTTNDMIDQIDALVGDEALIASVKQSREEEKKQAVESALSNFKTRIEGIITTEGEKLKSQTTELNQHWEIEKRRITEISQKVKEVVTELGSFSTKISTIQSLAPSASSTDDPELASTRTRIRTSLNESLDMVQKLESKVRAISESSIFAASERSAAIEELEKMLQVLKTIQESLNE